MNQGKSAAKADGRVSLRSFDANGVAVVFGATGGIGAALVSTLVEAGHFHHVIGFSRTSPLPIELTDERTLAKAAEAAAAAGDIRVAIDATGFLHAVGHSPEKALRNLDPNALALSFAINAIGPALLMKHILPRLPRTGKAVFATLSARVGSIGDNRLGGWYGYRSSKAALNQLVRTAAIELARLAPEAICVALHPGTVATPLSVPFAKAGLEVQEPANAARNLLTAIDNLDCGANGGFYDWCGSRLPW